MEFSTRPVRNLVLVMVAALVSACAPKGETPARKAIDQKRRLENLVAALGGSSC